MGVFLVDSNDGGVIVQNNLKLPLVSNVKNKKDLDPLLVNLKKLVSKKSVEAISKRMVFFYIKVCFVFWMLMILRIKFRWKLIVFDIIFSQEPPRCFMIYSGMGWRRILQKLWLSFLIVNKWKLRIKNQLVWLKTFVFPRESRKILMWTLLWVYLVLVINLIQFGLLWIEWRNQHN